LLKGVLEEGKPWQGAGYFRFALFEADSLDIYYQFSPRLRRYAPYLGLTKFNLFEVVSIISRKKYIYDLLFHIFQDSAAASEAG
jgi:hypothetical protein